MPKPRWDILNQQLGGVVSAMAEKQKQEQEMKQALSLLVFKTQLENQMKQQDPSNQLAQIRMMQELQQAQRSQQFNRNADIAFGGQNPTASEVLPLVPQNLRQKFMQRPVSPPGLAESLRQRIRQPYEQAGQGLVPGKEGWERMSTRTPITFNQTVPPGFEITGYDQRGAPMIRKIKVSAAQEKRNVEIGELENQIDTLVDFFRSAREEAGSVSGVGSSGVSGRLAGQMAIGKARLGYSPAVKVYQDKIKAFATTVAKAAGEVRPTDEDIRRFVQTLPSLEKNDQENEIIISELYNDLNSRGAKAVWDRGINRRISGNQGARGQGTRYLSAQRVNQSFENQLQSGRNLDSNTAMQILQRAGGDKNKARALARQMGYTF